MRAVQHVRLFVYGTLKRGFAREDLMRAQRFEGAATTAPGYALYDLGEYPALVREGDGVVEGELYSVAADYLDVLDRYEGYPELYGRENVLLQDGRTALAYVMDGARLRGARRIDPGVWRAPAAR